MGNHTIFWRSLVEANEEVDGQINFVFEFYETYEKQSYIEVLKNGVRLTMELAGN